MIAFPSEARVWLATGHTDMRKGFGSLALLVQENLKRSPHGGDLYVFRGRQGIPRLIEIAKDVDGGGLPSCEKWIRLRHDSRELSIA